MKYELTPVDDCSCPVCRQTGGKRLYEVDVAEAAQHFTRAEVDPEENRQFREEFRVLWGGDHARVVRCDHCGFCFADPYVAGSANFYRLFLKNPHYPVWRWEFDQTGAALRELAPGIEGARLLEIGAGDGAFVRSVCPGVVPKERVVCTEYSAPGAQAIRDYGVRCEMTDVRALRQAGHGDFTFVCLFQVLEHLDDLETFFGAVTELTRRPAHLFISVPNDEYIAFCELNHGLLDMPPNHIGRWNRTCFDTIGRCHGWSLVDHRLEPTNFRSLVHALGTSRYIRRRAAAGTLANRTSRFNNRTLRRLAGMPLCVAEMVAAVPAARANRGRPLGGAQWAHLRRE